MKIYENFKPILKFFYKSIKAYQSNKKLRRILLVEDTKLLLKSLKKMTNAWINDLNLTNQFEVISAYDGVDAFAIFKIDHYISQTIDCIITDQNMTMMNGLDLLKLVEKHKMGRNIQQYMCSTDNDILKNITNEQINYLSKPTNKNELKKYLNELLNCK